MDRSIVRLDKVVASPNLDRLFYELSGEGVGEGAGVGAGEGAGEGAGAGDGVAVDVDRINSLIASGRLAFYGAFVDGGLVGMASVIPLKTAVSDKLWIEDVCVLSSCRGLGLGRALMEFVLSDAATLFGGGTFWLTSRPSRTAARALYQSLGFVEHSTGVFRLG